MLETAKNQTIPPGIALFNDLPDDARVSFSVVRALTGKSRPTIYRHVAIGILPRPIKHPGCQNAWRVGDLRAALRSTPQTGA